MFLVYTTTLYNLKSIFHSPLPATRQINDFRLIHNIHYLAGDELLKSVTFKWSHHFMFYMEIEWYTAPALEHNFGRGSADDSQIAAHCLPVLWLLNESNNRTELICLFQTVVANKSFLCLVSLRGICLVPLWPPRIRTQCRRKEKGTFNCSVQIFGTRARHRAHESPGAAVMSVWVRIDSSHTRARNSCLCEREEQEWDKVGSDHCCSTLSDSEGSAGLPSF